MPKILLRSETAKKVLLLAKELEVEPAAIYEKVFEDSAFVNDDTIEFIRQFNSIKDFALAKATASKRVWNVIHNLHLIYPKITKHAIATAIMEDGLPGLLLNPDLKKKVKKESDSLFIPDKNVSLRYHLYQVVKKYVEERKDRLTIAEFINSCLMEFTPEEILARCKSGSLLKDFEELPEIYSTGNVPVRLTYRNYDLIRNASVLSGISMVDIFTVLVHEEMSLPMRYLKVQSEISSTKTAEDWLKHFGV